MTLTRLLAIALAVVMLAAACGGSDDADLSAGSSSGSADDSGASEVSSGSASEASSSEASTSEASTSEASSSDASSSTASSSESASAAEDVDGEPTRDVVHKYGTTSIAGQPERVVTIGFSEQDPVLALGVVPVAVREWFGGYDHAAWPWAQEALGDGTPTVLDMPFGELAYETIAGLDPDLIVGTHAGLTEEEYELLTAIAPTIVEGPDDPAFGMSWEDQTRLIGQALGTGDEANQIVTVTLASILDAERVNEGFGGATFAWANPTADGTYWVVGQSTPPMQFLQTLGLTYPAEIAEIVGDLDSFEMSAEQIDLLDVDVLIVRADEQVRGLIEADPLWGATAVIQEDRVLWLDAEDPVYGALSFSTILSIDYLVDELTPMIAEIVDRVGSGAGGSARSDEATTAAMEAFAVVYNSDAAWEDKSPFLQNSAALEASNEAYRTAAEGLGGISLEPSDATIDGNTATITYDVIFGDAAAYEDLTRTVTLDDNGAWIVSAADFCDFLASARAPCEEGALETSTNESAVGDDGTSSEGSDEATTAAMEAFAVVYNSDAAWEDKSPFLQNSAALEASNEAYRTAAEGLGGISLEPSDATIDGNTATITYDVIFGDAAAYEDLTRTVTLDDNGAWIVSAADFCDFLASARTPCEAGALDE